MRNVIVASALVLLLPGCIPRKNIAPQSCVDSGIGDTDKKKPIVCLDDRNFNTSHTFVINPDPVESYRTEKGNHIKIAWVTASGGRAVDVKAKDAGCVDESTKKLFTGGCTIKTATGTGHKQCSYSVTVDGVLVDPVVIIDDNPTTP